MKSAKTFTTEYRYVMYRMLLFLILIFTMLGLSAATGGGIASPTGDPW